MKKKKLKAKLTKTKKKLLEAKSELEALRPSPTASKKTTVQKTAVRKPSRPSLSPHVRNKKGPAGAGAR